MFPVRGELEIRLLVVFFLKRFALLIGVRPWLSFDSFLLNPNWSSWTRPPKEPASLSLLFCGWIASGLWLDSLLSCDWFKIEESSLYSSSEPCLIYDRLLRSRLFIICSFSALGASSKIESSWVCLIGFLFLLVWGIPDLLELKLILATSSKSISASEPSVISLSLLILLKLFSYLQPFLRCTSPLTPIVEGN